MFLPALVIAATSALCVNLQSGFTTRAIGPSWIRWSRITSQVLTQLSTGSKFGGGP
jgi:hypothetical protein